MERKRRGEVVGELETWINLNCWLVTFCLLVVCMLMFVVLMYMLQMWVDPYCVDVHSSISYKLLLQNAVSSSLLHRSQYKSTRTWHIVMEWKWLNLQSPQLWGLLQMTTCSRNWIGEFVYYLLLSQSNGSAVPVILSVLCVTETIRVPLD